MFEILGFTPRRTGEVVRHNEKNATAKILTETIGLCPHCQLVLLGHQYQLIASTILRTDRSSTFNELLKAVKDHDWRLLSSFQDWTGSTANLEVYALQCPASGLSVAAIISPVSLEEPYMLIQKEVVPEGPQKLVADDNAWHPL